MTLDKFPDDFEFITAMQQAKARAEDFQRHQDAVAGRETGYGNKHERGADAKAAARGVQMGKLSALDLALQDQDYAALYQGVSDLLSDIETTTEAALVQAQQALDEVVEKAARLPDGRAVFKDKDGNKWTEDGKQVDPETAAGIVWPDGAPSREDYLARKQALEELRRYQVDVIGKARDRMNDPDNPPSKEELDRIRKDIEEKAPAAVRASVAPEQPETDHVKTASHEVEVFKFD